MRSKRQAATAAVLVAVGALAGCSSSESNFQADRERRAADVLSACRDHGGVTAFDDDAVICRDQTFNDERGANAVEACRGRDGVSAFDDDIVICGDQSFHEAEGG